ncbi:hypothetical protein F4813DRAFT_397624 [Daldinia decipiens]|uniref:uncharacterized protein n=1 Tax=Daldinia decipiens TaxID=326647 RepID=UPI0020C487E4|nr:uncharacterized protein F4813DRAFT_397624 [Daldinia decipiens]KAI1656175.1 hypothetical protein F4813DRAFT_397624 [Daldinia decipiens]
MHASKKLDKVDRNGSITLRFTDGTTHECDILVGADGIHSAFAVASNDSESKSEPLDRWERIVGVDEIKQLFQEYPSPLNKAVDELLCNQPEHQALYLWEHPKAHTYVSGPMCVTGDAAHSTTPWQGSGGGMSIEDSLILSALLGRAKTPTEALTALKVYDQVRRPRTQRIVESSRITGNMLIGRSEETKLVPKMFKSFLSRWDFIIDIDMEKHRDEALRMMEAGLKEESTM